VTTTQNAPVFRQRRLTDRPTCLATGSLPDREATTVANDVERKSHKDYVREQVTGAIGQICDAWIEVAFAAAARGFPNGGDNGGRSQVGGHGDPTASLAMTADVADDWIRRARATLVLVLRFSGSGAPNRWTGRFDPVAMRATLKEAGSDLVDMWPKRVQRVFDRLYDLADQALREWPPTPKPGALVGDVRVGQRKNDAEVCNECKQVIGANVSDPLSRLDGKPYHRKPCYETVRKRKQRMK
jgi:hypothetical protein